jgi:glyoxylase-like metal-dependent hydrolase (beta-lactamase superfamily II)
MALTLLTSHDPVIGEVEYLSPLVRRVTCANPGPFTFRGTGTYIVGRGDVAVIDPGPSNELHVAALQRALLGETIIAVLVTHTHGDHSPATRLLDGDAPTYGFGPHPLVAREAELLAASRRALRSNAPESASERADAPAPQEEPSDYDFVPDVRLADSDVVRGSNWTIESLHTPGHISNHLCFALHEERTLFSGDHVMGWSTTVLPAPDGHLGDYLASLHKVAARPFDRYLPTHGPQIVAPHEFVAELVRHRQARTAQVIEQLRSGPAGIKALVAAMYVGLDSRLVSAAGRSVLAHLLQLQREGSVTLILADNQNATSDLLVVDDLDGVWQLA